MKKQIGIMLFTVLMASFASANHHMMCLVKNKSNELENKAVEGENDAAKQAACKKLGGHWTKSPQDAKHEVKHEEKHEEKKAGGSGGW